MDNKFEEIVNNYVNGNISDFFKQVGELKPYQCFAFIQYCQRHLEYEGGGSVCSIINLVASHS